jgi:peptidylprolyl isomerase/peptidyl-prolyl cis-trans isomerase A (cyclophilin A)
MRIPSIAAAAVLLAAAPAAAEDLYATFDTSMGKIGVKLLPSEAPKTVKNFVELAEGKREWTDPRTGQKTTRPLYDGTLFHRVIPGFMIQGGDPLGNGTGGPGYKFENELPRPPAKLFEKPCVLAMANSGPDTNGSQFFITEGYGSSVPQLEPKSCVDAKGGVCGYTRFGTGVCGCDLVGQIARAGNSKVKLNKVVITSKPPTCK